MCASIAGQSPAALGGETSILVRQRRDHAELDRLMNLYESSEESAHDRLGVLKDIVQLTFSHAFAEETVLWPLLRRLAPDGEELTSRVEREHQEINELVAELERTDPGSDTHELLVIRAFGLIRQDIRDEEDLLLPRLQEAMEAEELRRIGATWETVRRTAPTHPHPAVPRRPPGNVLLGVPLSPFDRIRDLAPAGARATHLRNAALALCAAALALRLLRTDHRRRQGDR
ncbi:hemerythrin domain-containing protein [Streptomyces sp. NPDC005899]|uniref:hemerythrin domain-containing protein n=1 Tax=Streptomyces sp. NPDC005899 TaxID=3155716 RepID=UPI0033DDFE6F